jgi:hypothetical protein
VGQCSAEANLHCQIDCQTGGTGGTGGAAGQGGNGSAVGGRASGGVGGQGGAQTTGGNRAQGGTQTTTGGKTAQGGSAPTGGSPAQGGTQPGSGGQAGQGGAQATGGIPRCNGGGPTGGSSPTGGCGSGVSAGGVAGGGGGGGGGGPTCVDLKIPSYIDVNVCYCFTDDGTSAAANQCHACCIYANYSGSSFIYNRHCTCGNPPVRQNTDVCKDAVDSISVCMDCCSNNGFTHASQSANSCACSGGSNADVCAATLDMSNPLQACPYCCINNGYLGFEYSAMIGGPHCTCSG